jgi:hypothetical protein
MAEIGDEGKAIADQQTSAAEIAPLQKSIAKGQHAAKDVENKYKLQVLEAKLSCGKFVAGVVGVVLVMTLAGDQVARLLRPKTPSLRERVALFQADHDTKSALSYLDGCVLQFQSLRADLSPAAVLPASAPAPGSGQSSAASVALMLPAIATQAPGSAPSEPVKLRPHQVDKLRQACGQLTGE